MQLYYSENIDNNNIIVLSPEESFHCAKVMRLKKGDSIFVTDGRGNLYSAKLVDSNPKRAYVEIVNKEYIENQKKYKLHIAIAPTKNIDRFEWFVEKAVEIGIDTITPIICRYSERKTLKLDRIERIIISAMKQSLKYHKPILNEITDYKTFVETEYLSDKYLAYCKSGINFVNTSLQNDVLFLVGPEGGFSDFEVDLALKNNFKSVKINEFRLRTETAGVFVAASVNLKFQK
ncbi:MAG: 16S rRNA (uracil(1498)-N(3))-methyltransferase [Bacteroidales bacterium]|nr:16S rRNA (uracil(1498)-N(3))-methyltransferase [Bacteroidales bacterium]